MLHPIVSIIVPVYQVEDYLPMCLEPLVNQRCSLPYEIVIVDDGSTDRSGEIAESYHQRHPQLIKVIHTANQGLPVARNTGLHNSSGEFVSFVDSDDIPSLDFIMTLYEGFQKKRKVECVNAGYEVLDGNGKIRPSLSKINGAYKGLDAAKKLLNDVRFRAYVWTKMFKRSLLMNNGISFYPFRTAFEDLPFVFASFLSSHYVVCTSKPIYTYRVARPGSLLNGGTKKERLSTHIAAIFACRSYADRVLGKKKAIKIFKSKKYRFYAQILADLGPYDKQKGQARKSAHKFLSHIDDMILPVDNTFAKKAVEAYGGEDLVICDGSIYDFVTPLKNLPDVMKGEKHE